MTATEPAPFAVRCVDSDGTMLVSMAGDLDSVTVSSVRSETAAVVDAPRVVIDLTQVLFIDSAGLGFLIALIRRIRERGGAVALCVGRDTTRRVLRVTGMDRLVVVHDTVEEAAAAVMPRG